jgi:four helix bundle protein
MSESQESIEGSLWSAGDDILRCGDGDSRWMATTSAVRDHKDLTTWQVSLYLCLAVYRMSRRFPGHERFGLVAEMRKTARSVICNIAEGHQRHSTREFLRFLDIAQGSRAELESQLIIASRLGYLSEDTSADLMALSTRVGRLVSALSRTLRKNQLIR